MALMAFYGFAASVRRAATASIMKTARTIALATRMPGESFRNVLPGISGVRPLLASAPEAKKPVTPESTQSCGVVKLIERIE